MADLFSQRPLQNKFEERFQKALNRLNEEQRKAVELIEGPVMVIAGPGTGKTQILAVRIGNILKQLDAAPHNILCLTFTDAATIAMRNRLVEIIGPEGHKVHIYTFHAFCNQVIQENLGLFGNYRQFEPLSDLEKVDVFDEIVDSLPPEHILKRLKGDPRFEAKRLSNLFDLMKKENLSADDLDKKIDSFLERKKDSDEFIAKRKTPLKSGKTYLKGEFRDDKFEAFNLKYEELRAGARLFPQFNKIMDRIGRYDYNDMILWVLKAFEENDELLGQYQERYQYFLVDEYQDTNGAQNGILTHLIHFMDYKPNAFVVGDDDQAIYKFQGANLNNIKDFKRENQPELIVLEKNYRSNQSILDASSALIGFNLERIVNDSDLQLTKNLKALGPSKDIRLDPQITFFENIVHEQADLAYQIELLHQSDEDLGEIAVIYRKHAQVDKLVEVLEKKNIPINIKKKIDILKIPIIDNILNILYYIQSEYEKPDSEERRLFELMHYNFFHINARDIAKIALYKQTTEGRKMNWRDLIMERNILEELKIRSFKDILALNDLLDKWVADISNVTLQMLFENILNEGQILQYILQHPDKTWLLQIISTFFDYIKEETNKDPGLGLKNFLEMIDKMKAADIPLQINKVVNSEKGIHFVTAHSAKGLEFNHVFLIGCTKDVWDKSSGGSYKYNYPDNINVDVNTNTEDERRLFFVAMTRAKTKLVISYALQKENGKDLGASQFVDEILATTELEPQKKAVPSELVEDFQYQILLKQNKKVQLIDHDLIDRMLEKYKLSVTGLNKYLACPMSFYFETILKVPTARNKHMGFGRAIHRAFQLYFEEINKKGGSSKDALVRYFQQGMADHQSHFTVKEFEDLNAYGEITLNKYFNEYLTQANSAKSFHLESKIDNAEYKGIPIKGVLDKVEIFDKYVHVIDYKTGDHEKNPTKQKLRAPNEKKPEGGDYWRQIIFYKMLLDSDKKYNWSMQSGEVDFVEPGKKSGVFFKQKYSIAPVEIEMVGDQIEDTWKKINDHQFNQLCDDERCYWCNFVRNDYVFGEELELDSMEEIYEG